MIPQQQPQAAMMTEPPAFRENWKKILASSNAEETKIIRVLHRVASISNGKILVRYPVDMADGFYHLSNQNELFPTKPYGWMSYPDYEQVRPSFESMKPIALLPNAAIRAFVELCEGARQVDAQILADARGMCWKQNSQMNVEFPLGITGEGLVFRPVHLKLALFEMLRYDQVALWKEDRLDMSQTPLVLGFDWGRCALIQAGQCY